MKNLWMDTLARIEALAPKAFALSEWMAAHPEISGEEREACRRHVEFLQAAGFETETNFCGLETSYDARLQGTGPGASVALMAEYDALQGLRHACGHNVHGTMSLLAGAALAPVMREIPGLLRVIGTPSEETIGAKGLMADRGAFDGLDLAMMIHCEAGRSFVAYRALAVVAYEFTFEGKTTHAAASPWEGHNALNGLRLLFDSLDMRRQHLRPEVRIHGVVKDGGVYANIVPEKAVGQFHFRDLTIQGARDLANIAFDCAKGAALCTGTTVSWKLFEEPFMDIKPNSAADRLLEDLFREFQAPSLIPAPFAVDSTDVGNVSYKCAAVQPVLDIADGEIIDLHTHAFADLCGSPQARESIERGAKILAKAALTVLTDPGTARAIQEGFAAV